MPQALGHAGRVVPHSSRLDLFRASPGTRVDVRPTPPRPSPAPGGAAGSRPPAERLSHADSFDSSGQTSQGSMAHARAWLQPWVWGPASRARTWAYPGLALCSLWTCDPQAATFWVKTLTPPTVDLPPGTRAIPFLPHGPDVMLCSGPVGHAWAGLPFACPGGPSPCAQLCTGPTQDDPHAVCLLAPALHRVGRGLHGLASSVLEG